MARSNTAGLGRRSRTRLDQSGVGEPEADEGTVVLGAGADEKTTSKKSSAKSDT